MEVVQVSDHAVLNNGRYEVQLQVKLYKQDAAALILHRLNNSTVLENGLHKVSVYVLEPKDFLFCLEWKRKEIEKKWKEISDMTPSVP